MYDFEMALSLHLQVGKETKMSVSNLRKKVLYLVLASLLTVATSVNAPAQASPTALGNPIVPKKSSVYEDREIRVTIPPGWRTLSDAETKKSAGSLGNSVSQAKGKLILAKNGYVLGIAYNTDHASGIEGGRFIEIFDIPWPGLDDAWNCSMYLRQDPWPASRHLIFANLIVDTGDPKVQENCNIQKELGSWSEKDGQKQYDGDRRWFGGYFTTEYGGYFFGGNDDGCGLKGYTLTSQARTPEKLPINDILSQNTSSPLRKIIQEAIDIVNSIQYKRCKPF
jgi:hypothetical protein